MAGCSRRPEGRIRRCGCGCRFEKDGKPHQRAYTLVDPDPEAGTFSLEFALHEGPACAWAREAKAGDTIDATLQGTGFTLPDPAPARLFVIGDAAALPAVNSLLDAVPRTPATIWFETAHEDDRKLPFRLDEAHHTLHHVERREAGAHLVAEVKAALPGLLGEDRSDAYVWVACDTVHDPGPVRVPPQGAGPAQGPGETRWVTGGRSPARSPRLSGDLSPRPRGPGSPS
ncbi:hypothetical protein SCALM49S_05009 [Streptomyces californicus]